MAPPCLRAYSQLKMKVRALPMCTEDDVVTASRAWRVRFARRSADGEDDGAEPEQQRGAEMQLEDAESGADQREDEAAAVDVDVISLRGEVESQKALANEMTALVHGQSEADSAIKTSLALFGGSLEGLNEKQLDDVASDMPTTEFDHQRLRFEIAEEQLARF